MSLFNLIIMKFENPEFAPEPTQEETIKLCKERAIEAFKTWGTGDLEDYINSTMDPEKEMNMHPTITEGFGEDDCKKIVEIILKERKENK